MPTKILFTKGDITEMAVDAIVNPANTDLTLTDGVAGAIGRKGGASVREECERLAPIALGEAIVTTAGVLKAFYVVHAAIIKLGGKGTEDAIRLATHNTLLRAEEKGFKSIAFPALGTGAAGFRTEQSAEVMLQQVFEHLKSRSSLEKILFVLFDDSALGVFEETYKKVFTHPAAEVA